MDCLTLGLMVTISSPIVGCVSEALGRGKIQEWVASKMLNAVSKMLNAVSKMLTLQQGFRHY